MNDNVLKFKRPEKQPEPPKNKPRGPAPGWVPFAALAALALIIFFVQRSGMIG